MKKKIISSIIAAILIFAAVFAFAACTDKGGKEPEKSPETPQGGGNTEKEPEIEISIVGRKYILNGYELVYTEDTPQTYKDDDKRYAIRESGGLITEQSTEDEVRLYVSKRSLERYKEMGLSFEFGESKVHIVAGSNVEDNIYFRERNMVVFPRYTAQFGMLSGDNLKVLVLSNYIGDILNKYMLVLQK